MNNKKILISIFFLIPLLFGCSSILEPVSFVGKNSNENVTSQEKFDINVKALTYKSAKRANMDPYPRHLKSTGMGAKANVYSEEDFHKNEIPPAPNSNDYILGLGDEISFSQIIKYAQSKSPILPVSPKTAYLLGFGDQLAYLSYGEEIEDPEIVRTEGVIGSNGDILLLGLGSIKAVGRNLNDLRTEVRNILIRNGSAPDFQLEITQFNSKQAFIFINYPGVESRPSKSDQIQITNVPVTLKEIAMQSGLSQSLKNTSRIALTRNGKTYVMTVGKLFEKNNADFFIQSNDQIEIDIALEETQKIVTQVASNGKIQLPGIGNVTAAGKTLKAINLEINQIIKTQGLEPNFQLEITKFKSQEAYLILQGDDSKTIPLTNKNIFLKDIILSSGVKVDNNYFTVLTLKRKNKIFRLTLDKILNQKSLNILIIDGDQIEIEYLEYKPGQVYAIAGADTAEILPINPSNRETLADALFVKQGALSNTFAKRSEVYLLRGKKPSVAYHLDAQNVARILIAAKTELRPNDIIYVAERPIISFSRTLAELTPLRILLRDIESGNIP
jgi:protein involved in polysaccharide export with SLBB domain